MLSLEEYIINRIRAQVPGFITVGNPSKIAGLREIGPLLPGCFVMPGAGEPVEQSVAQLPTLEKQDWQLIIIVPHQHRDEADGLTETVAGSLMNSVLKALHGWKDDASPQRCGFRYEGREPPTYSIGYAEFPLNFSAQALIGME